MQRFKSLGAEEQAALRNDSKAFSYLQTSRSLTADTTSLGENLIAFEKPAKNSNFVFGSNKKETQLTIMLKRLAIGDLNDHESQSTNLTESKKKFEWIKPRILHSVLEKMEKQDDEEIKVLKANFLSKIRNETETKYFETQEGKVFLESLMKKFEESEKNISDEQIDEIFENHIAPPAAEQEENTEYIKSIEPDVRPLSDVEEPKQDKETLTIPEPLAPLKSKLKPGPKIPASLRGTKPGVIPNTVYLEREGATRRKTFTASTAQIRKDNVSYGIGSFVVAPKECKFGTVKAEGIYEINLMLTNVGIDGTRFKVKKEENSLLSLEYKVGLVAPGITLQMKVRLNLHDVSPCEINEKIQIINEADILNIKVTGSNILSNFSCYISKRVQ